MRQVAEVFAGHHGLGSKLRRGGTRRDVCGSKDTREKRNSEFNVM
jgi:hypothetical protein